MLFYNKRKMRSKLRNKNTEMNISSKQKEAAIPVIGQDHEMREHLEDKEDLKALEAMRKMSLKFRRIEDFLRETQRRHS